MKNRVFNKDNADKPQTLGDAAIAFMKKIKPYILGVKVSVIVNEDHSFAFQYAETNLVSDALLGMEIRPVDDAEQNEKESEKAEKRRSGAGDHNTVIVLSSLIGMIT